jgi:hypothetical protein
MRFVVGFPLRLPGFEPRSVHVGVHILFLQLLLGPGQQTFLVMNYVAFMTISYSLVALRGRALTLLIY